MGSADIVPGVSGGTIALVLGIYERLVNSIREGSSALAALIKADMGDSRAHLGRVEWMFLVPLLAGILLAVVTLSSFLEHQLEESPTILAGAFFGLVVGSVLIAWRLIRRPAGNQIVVAGLVGLVLFILLGVGEEVVVRDPSLLVFFGSGALAICAMILPGISGSLILVLIGMYPVVLGAVNDRDLSSVGIFTLGTIIGLALFSQLLAWALRRHHDVILAALIGLMAGSLRVLWPWPEGVDSSDLGAVGDDWAFVILAGVIGLAAVYLIARLAAAKDDEVSERPPAA